jgi:hypothetical protein
MASILEKSLTWLFTSMDSTMAGFSQDSVAAACERAEDAATNLETAQNTPAMDISAVSGNHGERPPPPDYWTVVENSNSFTVNVASIVHAQLWEEPLRENYTLHKENKQHGLYI